MQRALKICLYVNAALAVALSLYLFIIPAVILIQSLRDSGLSGGSIPRCAFRWHKALSPKYEKWARQRVASGRAGHLTTGNIAGTEWPLFGSVFYLWATEALQEAVQENPSLCRVPPNQYARGAIEAAAALVADPNHAGWVRQHWGDSYLEKENLFYRMLLIPRILSNVSEAPYLGEAATLFALPRRSWEPLPGDIKARLPAVAYVGIAVLLALGCYETVASLRKLRRQRRDDPRWYVPAPLVQVTIWAILLAMAVVVWLALGLIAAVFLLAALVLPWRRRTGCDSLAYTPQKRMQM
jgi:hypothetical protein